MKQQKYYGILDTGYVSDENWEIKCQALIEGGCGLIQLRAKDKNSIERESLLKRILPYFETITVPLIINDDCELACRYPNLGLHIGQDDMPVEEARNALGPDRILGLSTHSENQIDTALELSEYLSYFAVGPVFPTQTKPDYIPVGLNLVNYAASKKPTIPFYCIGGINRTNAHQVAQSGAKGIVTVSDVLCDDDTALAVKETIQQFES